MEIKTFFAQDSDGKTIPDARITVRRQADRQLAAGLQDAAGGSLSNPFESDADGLIQLAAPNGQYVIDVEKDGSRRSLTAQFFDQGAVTSASGTQTLQAALDQRLIILDSVDTLRRWPAARVPDGTRLICRRFYDDLSDEVNVELQRRHHLDDTRRAGQMAWLSIDETRPDFHHFTLWSDDGGAYTQGSHEVHLLQVGFRADYNGKAASRPRGTDESAWLQETIDKTPFRNKYLPDLPNERGLYVGDSQIRLCSGTRIIGDGPGSNSRIVSDYVGASFRDGLLWMREPHVIAAWADGRPTGDIEAAFSHDIRISGITFEATDFASAAVALVCVRGVEYHQNHHVRCGGIKFFHELELNHRYSLGHEDDPTTDNAVMAGFHPQTPDDLNQDIRISHLSGGSDRYSYSPGDGKAACAVRLNFVRDFYISHVRMDFCNISGWGGSARPGKGGELRWMRRLRDGYIADVHCNRSNGAIYFNNAHNVKIYGCSARDVTDTAFDFEGCTYCLFDGIHAVNAGNFGISIFYATRGNVIKNFHALQTAQAAELRARYATQRFKPGLGKTLFRRLAGFEDPDYEQDVVLDTGSFVYEGEGFGLVAVDSWTRITYRNVTHHNVLMDLRAHSNAKEQLLQDNRFTFTKAANNDDVLVAIGPNSSSYACWKGGVIESTVEQPSGVIPLLAQARAYAGVTVIDIQQSRIDVPGVDTAIAISDARSTGRSPAHAFRLEANLVATGSRIMNLNLNQRAGGDAVRLDARDNRNLSFEPVTVETASDDDGKARYAALRIGLKATRPR